MANDSKTIFTLTEICSPIKHEEKHNKMKQSNFQGNVSKNALSFSQIYIQNSQLYQPKIIRNITFNESD